MQKTGTVVAIVGWCCLAVRICFADVVTEPQRRYGLGGLDAAVVSPDRRWMATCGAAGAFIWNFEAGTVVHRLEAHHAQVSAICFSPDSQVLLTGGRDRVIRAWNVESGLELRSFEGHSSEVMDLSFAPDGVTFVSAGASARVWSLATGDLLHNLEITGAFIDHALFARTEATL